MFKHFLKHLGPKRTVVDMPGLFAWRSEAQHKLLSVPWGFGSRLGAAWAADASLPSACAPRLVPDGCRSPGAGCHWHRRPSTFNPAGHIQGCPVLSGGSASSLTVTLLFISHSRFRAAVLH